MIHTFSVSCSVGYLRGVDVIAETSLTVTNEAQSFCWQGYGLKLHIPEGALPESESMCTVDIQVSISGQFQLHPSHNLASAVYWLHSKVKKFSKFLTLELQHCSKRSQISRLSFVECSLKKLPYNFKPMQGGIFSNESSYGSMELDHFSGYALVQESSPDQLRYCAKLYYWGERINRGVSFVITKNLEAILTVGELILIILASYWLKTDTILVFIQEASLYPNKPAAIAGADEEFEFDDDRITLKIPIEGVSPLDGWKVIPINSPTVSRTLPAYTFTSFII